jgi:L-rhamnose mutarotase
MERVCFTMTIESEKIGEYRERHRHVWPEMRDALSSAGWRNYSLFLRADGLVVGYLETESFDRALARMDALDVNRRWQREMADLVITRRDRRVDQSLERLPEIFHLP